MSTRIGVLAPLANRNFRLFSIGTLTSLMGDGFFRVALPLQVIALMADDATALTVSGSIALVGIAWGLGQAIALPFGGWAGDRYDRRTVMVLADTWRGLMIGSIALLSVTGNLRLWSMAVFGFGFGIGNGFYNPTAMAFVPELVPQDLLSKANALLGVARPVMLYIVGPLLGAGLIGLGGPGVALLVDAGTFVVSVAMLLVIRTERAHVATPASTPWNDIREGMGYVLRTRWAWIWLLGAGIGTLMFQGPLDVLFPVILTDELGMSEAQAGQAIAFVFGAGGVGALVAGTALGQWDLPRKFVTVMYVAEGLATAALVIIGVMSQTWHAVVAGAVMFTMFAVTDIIWATTMQRYVPRHLLGRVASVDWFTAVSLAPFSMGVAWGLSALVGPRGALVLAGIAGCIILFALLFVPGARDPERGLVEPAGTEA